jgi:cell division septation protein DedD
MNKNEEENQRDETVSASEASLDEELIGEATETTDDTEGTADSQLVEIDPSADRADDFSAAQTDEDTDDIAESGTDWLIDTGLAAAINPQSDIPEEASEDRESDNTGQEIAESELYDNDDNDEDIWEQDESEDDDYEDDLARSGDEDDFREDEQASLIDSDHENPAPTTRAVWPIVFGGIALVLIVLGGWDLFQERVTLLTRITELEQTQARTRESAALDAKTVAELEVENAALKLQLDTLYRDYNAAMGKLRNAPITGEATGENDDAQNTVTPSNPTTALEAQDDEPERSEGSKATPTDTGGWFINIGAYASALSANTWALRLQNSGYDVSVTEIETSEGVTLNRVRLTGFASKVAATDFAQELQSDYGTGPLWVGELPSGN